MAKELPYFRFEPSEWQNGNIQMFDDKTKVAFIEICCTYWQRLGFLNYAFALQRHCNGNADVLDSLIHAHVIRIRDDKICIEFLDEQLKELEKKSEKAAAAANKRWEKQGKDANAMQTHSKGNANRIDNNKINNNKIIYPKQVNDCFETCLKFFSKELHPQNEKQKDQWLDTIDKLNRIDNIPFDMIEKIVAKATQDEFWCKNFLSIRKLRQKNKDGVKYIKVFYIKFLKNGQTSDDRWDKISNF